MLDYYQLLKISPQAHPEEVRRAFRQAAKACHPDLYQGHDPAELQHRQRQFVMLTQAYETLSDPLRRREYDRRHAQSVHGRASAHQKARANASSSSDQKASYRPPPRSNPNDFAQFSEAELAALLREAEELLKQMGGKLQDPWEWLVEWARRMFQAFLEAWNETHPQEAEGSAFQSHSSGNSASSSTTQGSAQAQPPPSSSVDLEAELAALKQRMRQAPKPKTKAAPVPKQSATASQEVERELARLKQRHGKTSKFSLFP